MGVPSFYRWLAAKYPRVVSQVQEGVSGSDPCGPNPNGVEFDNLYLDMNGIIHPCCHPEEGAQPENEDEMIRNVFAYVDHVVGLIRPRKVLYLAIDGVAPRAKMNQQRARRFRAAQEAAENKAAEMQLRQIWSEKGWEALSQSSDPWDSNVITPGTPFMDRLAHALRYYVHDRLTRHPLWRGLSVLLSDASVPGEGEHKIMALIRRMRAQPGYNPDTKHVLYGLDADLFMLALATHEPHFWILREEVVFKRRNPREAEQKLRRKIIAKYNLNIPEKCTPSGDPSTASASGTSTTLPAGETTSGFKPFQLANVAILREYLEHELRVDLSKAPFDWDFERVIDDFVFLCFFVGNDFLPHLPSLEIREGAIDHLMLLYKKVLPMLGGYIGNGDGTLNFRRVNVLLAHLGEIENEVFRARRLRELHFESQRKRREQRDDENHRRDMERVQASGMDANEAAAARLRQRMTQSKKDSVPQQWGSSVAKKFELMMAESKDWSPDEARLNFALSLKAVRSALSDRESEAQQDVVVAGSAGAKQRYYAAKFRVALGTGSPQEVRTLTAVQRAYAQGLAWVFAYYYRGCPSWSWYYPFHYAPFASDLKNLDRFVEEGSSEVRFDVGRPFSPLGQLMGVLPAASAHALPESVADLMTQSSSVVADFYPTHFALDQNGKRYAWQAVVLLPFIDEKRLLSSLARARRTADEAALRRDRRGRCFLFVHSESKAGADCTAALLREDVEEAEETEAAQGGKGTDEDFAGADGEGCDDRRDHWTDLSVTTVPCGGSVRTCADATLPGERVAPLGMLGDDHGLAPVAATAAVCASYRMPRRTPHKSQLLPNVTMPQLVLKKEDHHHVQHGKRFGRPSDMFSHMRHRRNHSHNGSSRGSSRYSSHSAGSQSHRSHRSSHQRQQQQPRGRYGPGPRQPHRRDARPY